MNLSDPMFYMLLGFIIEYGQTRIEKAFAKLLAPRICSVGLFATFTSAADEHRLEYNHGLDSHRKRK